MSLVGCGPEGFFIDLFFPGAGVGLRWKNLWLCSASEAG